MKRLSYYLDGLEVCICNDEPVVLYRSKICGKDNCTYTKQKSTDAQSTYSIMALAPTGGCNCHLTKNTNELGCAWFCCITLSQNIHNHSPPSEWKILPHVLQDITQAVRHNVLVTQKTFRVDEG